MSAHHPCHENGAKPAKDNLHAYRHRPGDHGRLMEVRSDRYSGHDEESQESRKILHVDELSGHCRTEVRSLSRHACGETRVRNKERRKRYQRKRYRPVMLEIPHVKVHVLARDVVTIAITKQLNACTRFSLPS